MKGIGLAGSDLMKVGAAVVFATCAFACGQPESASSQATPAESAQARPASESPAPGAPRSETTRAPVMEAHPSATAPVAAASRAPSDSVGGGSHVVRPGETLATIARDHYGNTNRFRELYEANRDQIQDPNVIYPGQEFVLP